MFNNGQMEADTKVTTDGIEHVDMESFIMPMVIYMKANG